MIGHTIFTPGHLSNRHRTDRAVPASSRTARIATLPGEYCLFLTLIPLGRVRIVRAVAPLGPDTLHVLQADRA